MANSVSEPLIGVNALAYYLKRINAFIESGKKTLSFPKITPELQDILLRVVEESPEFLNSDEFSDSVRLEAARVAATMKVHEDVKLTYEISNGKHGSNVLSYIKTQVKSEDTFKMPAPLRPPNEAKSAPMAPPADSLVTSYFKLHCLNAATKFVKDDTQLVMRFPEMVSEQAQFLINMILPGKEGKPEKTDVGFGYRNMYAPLWESMRLFSLKYDYKIGIDTTQVTKDGMKRVVFEKIPKSKKSESKPIIKQEVIDVDAIDEVNNTSISTINMVSKNINSPKKRPNPPAKLTEVEKMIKRVRKRMRFGSFSPAFVHEACQRVSDFLLDDDKNKIVFTDVTNRHMQFLQLLKKLSCSPDTYMLFTSECQRYMDNIKYCIDVKNVKYITTRNKNRSFVFEKDKKSKTDVDDVETLSSCSSEPTSDSQTGSKTSQNKVPNNNEKKTKEPQKIRSRIEKVLTKLAPKLNNGTITEEFIQDSLERIRDFLNDDQQGSVLFKQPTINQQFFIQNVRLFALNKSSYSMFSDTCQRLLGDINSNLNGQMPYALTKCKGGKDYKLEKLAIFPAKKPANEKENKNTNIPSSSNNITTQQASQDLEELIRLKAVIYDVFKHSGEQTVMDLLWDISNFLTLSNMDRTITFDDMSLTEAVFVKHAHAASKTDDVYAMFTRECQKLLKSIRLNAQNYRLTVKMIADENSKRFWTVILEKQTATPHKAPVQHRARSLSAGRRVAQMVENIKLDPIPRGSSGQRPLNVREKLKAALAQPVRSDKALKMMEIMGWKGGALGARGDGITEPLALPLDLVTRAGLGHVPKPKKARPEPKKTKQPKPAAPDTAPTSDSPQLLRQTVKSIESLKHLVPPGIFPEGAQPPQNSKTITLNHDFRTTVLQSILELITTDVDVMYFVPAAGAKSADKMIGFVKHAVNIFNNRHKFTELGDSMLMGLVGEIAAVFNKCFDLELNAELRDNDVVVKKFKLIPIMRKNKKQDVFSLTDAREAVINKEDNTMIKDKEALMDNLEKSTKDGKDVRASRPWYLPVKSNFNKTAETSQVLDLKALARCKVFDYIDRFMTNEGTRNVQTVEDNKVTNEVTENSQSTQKVSIANINSMPEISKPEVVNCPNDQLSFLQIPTVSNEQAIETNAQESNKTTIDTEIINETAMEIQKALEKMMNIKEAKENTASTDNENTETVMNNQKPMETNSQKPARVRTLVKNVKIPNLTRKQLAILEEHGVVPDITSQRTTYTLRVEEYKINDVKHVDVKAKKASETPSREPRRKRAKSNQRVEQSTSLDMKTTDVPKTSGMILLEKLTINNNDSTKNKNPVNTDVSTKSMTPSVASRLVIAASTPDTNDLNKNGQSINIPQTNTKNIPSVSNNIVPIPKNAPAVNKVAPMIKSIETIDLTDDDTHNNDNDKKSDDLKHKIISDNNTKINANVKITPKLATKNDNIDLTQSETETVTYIVPVECEKSTELSEKATNTVQNDKNVTVQNRESQNENVATKNDSSKTNVVIIIDDDCQIVNDSVSTIVIKDENEALFSVPCDKIEMTKSTTNEQRTKVAENSYVDKAIEDHKEKKPISILDRKRPSVQLYSNSPHVTPKKCKLLSDFKKVCIQPTDYPQSKIDNEKAREIQSAILKSIDYTRETLPIFKCQGIQNGGLIYSCLDEKSLYFLDDLVKKMTNFKLTYEFDVNENSTHKMAFKINSYVNESVSQVLNRLELYNSGLEATEWIVLKKEQHEDFTVIYVEMDESSYNYVCYSNFILCVGYDCARFTILWD